MKTTENNNSANALIAEFMGAKITDIQGLQNSIYYPIMGKSVYANKLKFHTDWNWLIEVVIKCRGIQLDNRNKIADIYDALHNTDIKAVYNAVVSFIEWHNSAEKELKTEKKMKTSKDKVYTYKGLVFNSKKEAEKYAQQEQEKYLTTEP